jgi:hypothetical protein
MIEPSSAMRTGPTAQGSDRKPETNHAHHIVTTAPANRAAHSQTGGTRRRGAERARVASTTPLTLA